MTRTCIVCGEPSKTNYCTPHLTEYLRDQNYEPATNYAAARNFNLRKFYQTCETHGLVLWDVRGNYCLSCHPPKYDPLRSDARRAGGTTYPGACEIHGATPFGVYSGKCLMCFNSVGAPRRRGVEWDPTRARARAAGNARYMAECEHHGQTEFGVRYGRCLTCFTIDGVRRTRP